MLTTILLILSLTLSSIHTATLPNAPFYILKKKYSYGDYRRACKLANMKPVYITDSNIKTAYETMLGCGVEKVWVRGRYDPVTGEFDKNNALKIEDGSVLQETVQGQDLDGMELNPLCQASFNMMMTDYMTLLLERLRELQTDDDDDDLGDDDAESDGDKEHKDGYSPEVDSNKDQ